MREGKSVSVGQYLVNQNTSDGHIHMQVCVITNAQVYSGRDLTLICETPY
jgi:hypothetical protein